MLYLVFCDEHSSSMIFPPRHGDAWCIKMPRVCLPYDVPSTCNHITHTHTHITHTHTSIHTQNRNAKTHLVSGLRVVLHNCSGIISPRPLNLCTV